MDYLKKCIYAPFTQDIPRSCLNFADNQPKADLSMKKSFYSLIKKPETHLTIAAIAAFFITPLFISIPLSITTLVTVIGISLARLILLPSTSILYKNIFNSRISYDYQNASVKLSDGNFLRGIWNRQNKATINLADKKLLIVFHGNAAQTSIHGGYNDLKGSLYDLLEMNYRGTFNSDGFFASNSRHVKDGIEVVKAALDRGYKRKNITIIGHSLGGSLAPAIKAHFDTDKGQDHMTLIAYNTFYRTDTFISHRIEHPILKNLCRLVTKFFLKIIGWDYRYTEKQWLEIKGEKTALGGDIEDKVIPPAISLASMLKERNPEREDIIIENCDHNDIDPLYRLLANDNEKSTANT